jgi:phosphoribosylanthranilate isomerase
MTPAPPAYPRSGVRIKICGITDPKDARAAADAGADAIGLNFVAGPRRITPEQAGPIVHSLPPFVTAVALVGDEELSTTGAMRAVLDADRIRWLQWYGPWSDDRIERIRADGFRVIRVVHVGHKHADATARQALQSPLADAVLFDAASADGRAGGTGTTVDWHAISRATAASPASQAPRVILAGGLTAANVGDAIRTARPWAVDVSSGVESQVGVKDFGRMRDFVAAVRSARSDGPN